MKGRSSAVGGRIWTSCRPIFGGVSLGSWFAVSMYLFDEKSAQDGRWTVFKGNSPRKHFRSGNLLGYGKENQNPRIPENLLFASGKSACPLPPAAEKRQ